jgi:predicted O-methyltransferase YrrM
MRLDPSARIAPDSAAATFLHRAVMLARLPRSRAGGAPARPIAAALRAAGLGRLDPADLDALARVEARRAEVPFEMLATGRQFGLGPGPSAPAAPPASAPRERSPAERLGDAWEICRWSTIPPVWGRFIFCLIRELAPTTCLELGTGLGLSGLYTGVALELNGRGHLTTLDRDDAARIAERGFAATGLEQRVSLAFGDIDELLPELGRSLAPVDFALLDAEHSGPATIRHFDLVLPYLAHGAVVLLDDITQTGEMRDAWRRIVRHPRVGFNIALRRYGALVIGGENGP